MDEKTRYKFTIEDTFIMEQKTGKRLLSYLVFTILFLFILLLFLAAINNGMLVSNNFPIKQKWVTNLDSEIEALSTNGFQIVFVRTTKKLYALETNTGKVLWSQDLAWQGIPEPPIVMGENIYFADGKYVWAVDQKNGTVKWKQPVPLSVAEVRSASENFVAVEIEPYLYILDARDGATLWNKADCSFGGIQADIEKESVYVPCTGESTGQIRSFELTTGEKTWEIQTPFKNASVAFQDGNMYYLRDQNTVSAFDLQNRNVLWNNTFEGEGYKNFEVLEEYLFVSGSSRFCVFHLKDGKQIWCTSEVNNPQPPAVLQETLFIFNGRQNMITAYNLASGNKIGELSIRRFKLFAVQKKIMAVSSGFLIFGNSSSVVAYGE
jgi:outer membrane protein assembly factor BamB